MTLDLISYSFIAWLRPKGMVLNVLGLIRIHDFTLG